MTKNDKNEKNEKNDKQFFPKKNCPDDEIVFSQENNKKLHWYNVKPARVHSKLKLDYNNAQKTIYVLTQIIV